MKDWKDLEINGAECSSKEIKCNMFALLRDNMGSHSIGGFVENFSKMEHFCRYCLVTSNEFHKCLCDSGKLRDKVSYNNVK